MNIFIGVLKCFLSIGMGLFLIFGIYFFVRENKRLSATEKDFNRKRKKMIEVLEVNAKNELFDFNTIQTKQELLKKNMGHSMREKCPKIEYVEYCNTVCNFQLNKGETNV